MITQITLYCAEHPDSHIQISTSQVKENQCYLSFGDRKEEEQFIVWLDINDLKKAIDKLAL